MAEYSVLGIGASAGVASGDITLTLPSGTLTGSLLLCVLVARNYNVSAPTTPSGFVLLRSPGDTSTYVYGKIASASESNVTVTGPSGIKAGFMVALQSSTGWPTIEDASSIVKTSATGGTSYDGDGGVRYRSLTVSSSGTCGLQVARAVTESSANPTGVSVTSGYTAAGYGFINNVGFGVIAAAQMLSAPISGNLVQNSVAPNVTITTATTAGVTLELIPAPPKPEAEADKDSYVVGENVVVTASGFANTLTELRIEGGGTIAASGGATSTSASFVIPSVSSFVYAGSMAQTRLGTPLACEVAAGDEVSLPFDLTLNPPTSHIRITLAADWADLSDQAKQWVPSTAVQGDDILISVESGTLLAFTNYADVAFAGSSGSIEFRLFDVSSGSWSGTDTQSFEKAEFSGAVKDTFSGANGTILSNHTPDVDQVGNGWAVVKDAFHAPDPSGGVELFGNRLRITSNNVGGEIDVGAFNVDVSVDWVIGDTTNGQAIVHVRRRDPGALVGVWARQTNQIGFRASLGDNSYVPPGGADVVYPFPANSTHRIRVVAEGNQVNLYVNGVLLSTANITTHQSSEFTKVGIFSSNTNPLEFDNFEAYALSGPVQQQVSVDKLLYVAGETIVCSILPEVVGSVPVTATLGGVECAVSSATTTSCLVTLPDLDDFKPGGTHSSVPFFRLTPLNLTMQDASSIGVSITIAPTVDYNSSGANAFVYEVSDFQAGKGIFSNLAANDLAWISVTQGTITGITEAGVVQGPHPWTVELYRFVS
jgi:hypothetical protein